MEEVGRSCFKEHITDLFYIFILVLMIQRIGPSRAL